MDVFRRPLGFPDAGRAGLGSALLRHAAGRCDRGGLPAYLEATNPHNRQLYAAHGFEEIGVIQAGKSAPLWPKLRKPR